MEEINYPLLIVVVVLAVGLLVWLIMRNQKDEKSLEKAIIQTEIKDAEEQEAHKNNDADKEQ
ncbi:hypothetical protein GCM10023149_14560 [Mucilaginibacter gynuensis]|uniref:Uncharacterized protein n=1 Tax=Mucilaginibacter gynuensis TaxID=1302236 RepID=A0ABP8G464_9SPHI